MSIFLFAVLTFAALESLALFKKWTRLEYVAKPAVTVILFSWLWMSTGLKGVSLWFGAGILLSLVGDILLMISLDKLFLPALVAFLLAHVAYLIGFNIPVPEISVWGIVLAVMVGLGGVRIIRRIVSALAASGQERMRAPIIVYGTVISLMLLSAFMKSADLSWNMGAAALVSVGAFLFYLSDITLAWNKFVSPIRYGRIYNIGMYHLGQIALIAGVIAHFGN